MKVASINKRKESRGKKAPESMAIILEDVPPGHHWGWFSREDPRMHLQTVDRKHFNQFKVWLEKAGRRVFDPAGAIPAKVLKKLEAEVQKNRALVEGRWVNLMIEVGWLQLRTAGTKVTLTAYPANPNRFQRVIDLGDWFTDEALALIKPEDVILSKEMPALEIWPQRPKDLQHHIRLSSILWVD